MAIRQRQTVLNIAIKHFKEFGLPLDIDFKSYTAIVGPREALHPISVKRSFKAWKYLTHAVRVQCPELVNKPAPKPAPSKAPKPAPKAAVKPATRPAVKKDKDDE
tara:strand:- start:997 stop:1311 length:315 start_codon:yes stop_codon:yes gene_type:complete